MAIPSVIYYIGETRLYSMDFSALLGKGETLTGVSAGPTIDQATTPALTIGTPTVSGQFCQMRISGGFSDTRYLVSVWCTTSAGNTIKGEGYVQCRGPNNFTITPDSGGLGVGH